MMSEGEGGIGTAWVTGWNIMQVDQFNKHTCDTCVAYAHYF